MTINRPKALNALNAALFAELNEALRLIDADEDIGAVVITGSEGRPQVSRSRCVAVAWRAVADTDGRAKKLVLISRR